MTMVKKNYASLMEIQEGNFVPENKQLDIKGIECLTKSSKSEKTREAASRSAISVWLKAETEIISKRTQGRTHRPFVPAADNQRAIERLVRERYPIYAKADITVESFNEPPFKTANRVLKELERRQVIKPIPTTSGSSSNRSTNNRCKFYKSASKNR